MAKDIAERFPKQYVRLVNGGWQNCRIVKPGTTNTPLARRIAKWWEKTTGQKFPGGIANARIERLYPGHWQMSSGAWSWQLGLLKDDEGKRSIVYPYVGSQWPAREAIKKPDDRIDFDG